MSLYSIEEDLLRIFAEIEANEGEISEELWEELNLTKENFKDKLLKYVHAVRTWDADSNAIKDEVKKLQFNSKVKENRVKRLKSAMLDAVLKFGEKGKTNNFIELVGYRLYTKSSDSVETDDNRINALISEFVRFVRELDDAGVLYTGSDVQLEGILDSINANCKAEWENNELTSINLGNKSNEFIPYTLSDLTNLKLSITTTQSIYQLFRTGPEALKLFINNPLATQISDGTSKTEWKAAIEAVEVMNANKTDDREVSELTVAKLNKNTSLIIK